MSGFIRCSAASAKIKSSTRTTACRARSENPAFQTVPGGSPRHLRPGGLGQQRLALQGRVQLVQLANKRGGGGRRGVAGGRAELQRKLVRARLFQVVEQNFPLHNNELTLDGFLTLHQMEAEDNQGDPRELRVTVQVCTLDFCQSFFSHAQSFCCRHHGQFRLLDTRFVNPG